MVGDDTSTGHHQPSRPLCFITPSHSLVLGSWRLTSLASAPARKTTSAGNEAEHVACQRAGCRARKRLKGRRDKRMDEVMGRGGLCRPCWLEVVAEDKEANDYVISGWNRSTRKWVIVSSPFKTSILLPATNSEVSLLCHWVSYVHIWWTGSHIDIWLVQIVMGLTCIHMSFLKSFNDKVHRK